MRQHLHIKWIRYRITIDQVVMPITTLLALQDCTRLIVPEVDFNSQRGCK